MEATISNKEKARQNELQVLQAVGVVGWLTASQIGRWVWGYQNARSSRVSADKVLKRLQERALVLRRESGSGVYAFVLTDKGAAVANGGMTVPLFRAGYDLSQLDVARQAPAVEYLVAERHRGCDVLGKAGVRKALELGLFKSQGLREADGIVIDTKTGERKAVLVVRNTHPELVKKARKMEKAFGHLELLGDIGLLRSFQREMRAK